MSERNSSKVLKALVQRFSAAVLPQYVMSTPPVLVVLVFVATAGLFASSAFGAATATKTIVFSGHYSGTASLLIKDGSVTISSIKGKGTGTLVGASSVLGSGSSSAGAECEPFRGTGSITGTGSKIAFTVSKSTSQGCSSGPSGPVTVTFKGVARAIGGSGKTKAATGSLKFSGSLKLGGTSGSQSGAFKASVSGKLTVTS